MENAQITISSGHQTVTTKDGLVLTFNEVIIQADTPSTSRPDGYSFLNKFTGFEYGNYQMRILLSAACMIGGGIKLFPPTDIKRGQILRIRFRQNTLNEYDIVELMDGTSMSSS